MRGRGGRGGAGTGGVGDVIVIYYYIKLLIFLLLSSYLDHRGKQQGITIHLKPFLVLRVLLTLLQSLNLCKENFTDCVRFC
jgi:hypothetical protein